MYERQKGVFTLHASNIKGFPFEFACASRGASCVNEANTLTFQLRIETELHDFYPSSLPVGMRSAAVSEKQHFFSKNRTRTKHSDNAQPHQRITLTIIHKRKQKSQPRTEENSVKNNDCIQPSDNAQPYQLITLTIIHKRK